MKNFLKITLIQTNLYWQDIESNLSHFNDLISQSIETDIILLPEMFNTSFCPKSTILSEKMEGKTIKWMKRLSKQKNCSIVGTLMIKEKKNIFNRLVWVSKTGDIFTYDKCHLFSLAQEEKTLKRGNKRLIIEIDGWKICPLICYDLRFPVFSRNNVDYDMLIYLANWPDSRIDAWNTLLKARAIENQAYTIGLNRIGKDGNNILFNGHSKVFDAFGKLILSANTLEEEVVQVVLSLDKLKKGRRKVNFLKDRDNFSIQAPIQARYPNLNE